MRSAKFAVLGALIIATVVSADPKKELAGLSGKWKLTLMQFGETSLKEEQLKDKLLTIEDGKYRYNDGKGEDKGTITLDTKPEKKTMDLKGTEGPNKGKTLLCIYQIESDTLKVCYGTDGKRPTEFKATGTKQFVITYKKVKEEKK